MTERRYLRRHLATIGIHTKYKIIVTIFKKKADKFDCGNYGEIAVLSTARKILVRVYCLRKKRLIETLLSKSQCGFRSARGITDMIFTAHLLQEKCQEQEVLAGRYDGDSNCKLKFDR